MEIASAGFDSSGVQRNFSRGKEGSSGHNKVLKASVMNEKQVFLLEHT